MVFKRKVTLLLVILLISARSRCQAKEILCLLGVATETAEKWNNVLLTALGNKDHSLSVITPTMKWGLKTETNIDFIFLENTHMHLKLRYENQNVAKLMDQSIWKYLINWYDQQMATCQGNFESTGFSEALNLGLNGKRKFDLIIYDLTYGPGCLLHLAYLFGNVPIVGITSSTLTSDIINIKQYEGLNSAMHPFILSNFEQNMNYWQRLYNTALYGFDYIYRQWIARSVIEGLWSHNRYTRNIKVPKSVDELLPRFKLILANHHPALHTLKTIPNIIVPVPGLHIDLKSINTLNNELHKFMADFPLGTILINLDLKQLNENTLQNIIQVIEKSSNYGFIWLTGKQRIILKNKPHNLILNHKLQNQDILSQQNRIKCFITIPEILRIQESLYYGTPLVTITQRPEERYLAKRTEEQGFALNIPGPNFESSLFESTLQRCLNDKSLINEAQQLRYSFEHQQNHPLDTAVWWMENIMENPQLNDHLFSVEKQTLGYFAINSLDVLLLLQFLILICVINTILVCRQTFLNFKKISKSKRWQMEKKEQKQQKLKKDKKNKSKTT